MSRSIICFFTLVLCCTDIQAGTSVKSLPATYRRWLTEEVPYIIESQERNEFLSLTTDAARDAFIRTFWETRNPDPGAEVNTFKEEHYQRLAYANEHFGNYERHDGWSTDQGQTYITLGAPQSKVTYPNSRNVRPMEIWFYQGRSPALPPYFYILFYKRGPGDPFTIYSPYQDGPNRLITGLETLNDQKRSLQQLRKSLGDEVARTTVTLLPGEPVNFDEYQPSMISDTILSTIRGLADNPLEIQRVHQNRQREQVTASILAVGDNPGTGYSVVRDEKGLSMVDYFVRMPKPDPDVAGPRKDGRTGYDFTLREHITTEGGKTVYDTVSTLTGLLQPAQVEAARNRIFAAEDQLALATGHYVIQTTLTNNRTLEAHRVNTAVTVPPPSKGLAITAPVAYTGTPTHFEGQRPPFSFAGVRFAPLGVGTFTLHAGEPLRCIFQLWLPKNDKQQVDTTPVSLRFYYGSTAIGANPLDQAEETLDAANVDEGGSLVTGHEFHTEGLAPGTYRVIVRASQGAGTPVYSTATLHIVPQAVVTSSWSAYAPPEPQQDQSKRELSASASR